MPSNRKIRKFLTTALNMYDEQMGDNDWGDTMKINVPTENYHFDVKITITKN